MDTNTHKNRLFPIFLKLEQLRVLVVGAGPVALEKLTAVLRNCPDANVKLIAQHIGAEVAELINTSQKITVHQKEFEDTDLQDIDIAIVAVNNKATAANIRAAARKRNILVNVADTPDLCDFYLGSIVQKGNLKIGISTNGMSPTAAKRIKELLQAALPDEIDSMIDQLHELRNQLQGDFSEKVKRMNAITESLIKSSS